MARPQPAWAWAGRYGVFLLGTIMMGLGYAAMLWAQAGLLAAGAPIALVSVLAGYPLAPTAPIALNVLVFLHQIAPGLILALLIWRWGWQARLVRARIAVTIAGLCALVVLTLWAISQGFVTPEEAGVITLSLWLVAGFAAFRWALPERSP